MEYIDADDILEVYSDGNVDYTDLVIISRLYQPLIGCEALSLYITLNNYVNVNEKIFHSLIFEVMQITPAKFLLARKTLEACGLLKTFLRKKDNDEKIYSYIIYLPLSPKEFFKNTLFRETLIKFVGEDEAKKMFSYYIKKIPNLNEQSDISTFFSNFFGCNLSDISHDFEMPINLKDNKPLEIKTNFSFKQFFKYLNDFNIKESALNKNECVEIERLATLYGLDEKTIGDIVVTVYDENYDKKIDLLKLKMRVIEKARFSGLENRIRDKKVFVRVSGKTKLADEIRLMEELSPKDYLQNKQGNTPLAVADLKLIDYLNNEMLLNRGVINALVNYCLKHNNYRIPRTFAEKIASSLKRAKITTAIDAINYFEQPQKKTKLKEKDNNAIRNEKYDEKEYNEIIKKITKKV